MKHAAWYSESLTGVGGCLSLFGTVQVKDADRVQVLGSLTVPLSRLLSTPDLSLDQWFQLDKSGPASRIYMKAVLRVKDNNTLALVPPTAAGILSGPDKMLQGVSSIITQVLWLDEERVSSTVASGLEAGLSKELPQQTSPHPSFATEVRGL